MQVFHAGTGSPLVTPDRGSCPDKATHTRYDKTDAWSANSIGTLYTTNLTDKYGEWRSIPGFPDGCLLVSSMGWAVISSGSKWSKPSRGWMQKGYFCQQLHGHAYHMSRLVCRAFNGPPQSATPRVIHLAGCKNNNEASKLKWGTWVEARRLPIEQTCNYVGNLAVPIFARHIDWGPDVTIFQAPSIRFGNYKYAAKWFGVEPSTIGKAVREIESGDSKRFVAGNGMLNGWTVGRAYDETQDNLTETDNDRLSKKPEPMEQWKIDAETKMTVSNRGRLWRSGKGGGTPGKQTLVLHQCTSGKSLARQMHRMIYRAFVDPSLQSSKWISHRDGNVANNNLSNLERVFETPDGKGVKRRREELAGIRREFGESEWHFAETTQD